MSKIYKYCLAFLMISKLTFAQGQPGEEGPPYYGLELPPYGSGREAFEAFEKEVEKRKRAQPDYVAPPYENALRVVKHGPSFHEGVVLSYDEQSIDELKNLVFEENTKYRNVRSSSMHALGVIHSVDPDAVSFDELSNLISEVERSASLSEGIKVDILSGGYMGMSYSKDSQAYDFLVTRATGELWAEDEMPAVRYINSHEHEHENGHGHTHEEGFITTAQSDAIRALSGINDPRIASVLEKLRKETSEDKDYIHHAIPSGFYSKRDQHFEQLREAAYAKRLASLGITKTSEELVAEEVPASAPLVAEIPEVIEEVTAPEPAIEELAEVVVTELIEEDVEQSSNWWLWLVGLLVVVGAIGLAVRRKS